MAVSELDNLQIRLIGDALVANQSGVFEWRVRKGEISLSSGLTALLGFPAGGFDGRVGSFLNKLDPLDRDRIVREVDSLPPDQTEIETEFRVLGLGTRPRWFNTRCSVRRDDAGNIDTLIGLAQEIPVDAITERRMRRQQGALLELLTQDKIDTLAQDEALASIARKATATLSLDRASIWIYSGDGLQLINLISHDRKNGSLTTLPALEVPAYPDYFAALQESRALAISFAPTDPRTRELAEGYLNPLGITSMLEAPIRRRGQTIGVVCHEHRGPQRIWTLDEQHFAASVADLVTLVLEASERAYLLESLNHQSLHDSLTDLPNRSWLYDQLEARIAAARGDTVALLLFDLDRFKEINDTLGHNAGDEILVRLAGRLRASVAESLGDLARLSGDEFGVILRGISDEKQLVEQATRLLSIINQPIHFDGLRLVVHASCGISLSPAQGNTSSTLFRQADIALYQAKTEGRCRIYRTEKDHHSPRRLALMHDLIQALEQGAMEVEFQPKFNLDDRQLTGVEALSRWNHPIYGPISPEEFVPLAELGGLLDQLTLHVIRESAKLWARLDALGHSVRIAVNLSPKHFYYETGWEQAIIACLQESGMPPTGLELEITENAFIHDPTRAIASMQLLGRHGIHFSLDDFGTGYSSMAHLSKLPLDSLKIDRAFIHHIGENHKQRAIIRSTTLLGQELGLVVIAEGIEDAATAELLSSLGCHQGQGFHLGMPQSADSLLLTLNAK